MRARGISHAHSTKQSVNIVSDGCPNWSGTQSRASRHSLYMAVLATIALTAGWVHAEDRSGRSSNDLESRTRSAQQSGKAAAGVPLFCCLPSGTCVVDPLNCGTEAPMPVADCLSCIPPAADCWETPCGETHFDFCELPIPADFFDPGSEPFIGRIELQGDPVPGPDTIVQREQGMALDQPGAVADIPIEIVQLDLVSCQPITVTTNGQPELWDVQVTLSPNALPPGNTGMMHATKDNPNGGRFDSFFFVQPLFIFTRVDPPNDQRFLDLPLLPGFEPIPFEGRPGGAPWAHQILVPNSVPCPAPNFVPGVNSAPPPGCTLSAPQCCEEVGHAGPGHLHVTGTVCAPCECGACCDSGDGTCTEVVQSPPDSAELVCLGLGGEYKGPGTTCADADGDGVPDVRETNDCCAGALLGLGDSCSVHTDPRNPDTDGDGETDGGELALGFDPCNPISAGFCCLPSGTCVGDPILCGTETPTAVSDCRHCIPPADDCWNTACGATHFDFCDQPIPADFFDPGSDPFVGRVEFQGDPAPEPDTVVRRQEGMALDQPGDSAQIPIELVELNLVSCQPITVTTGGQPEQWDVRVTLSPNPLPPGNTGQADVHKDTPDGGRFDSSFLAQPLFIFTRVDPPNDQRFLDLPLVPGFQPLQFDGRLGGAPWSHEVLVSNSVPCPAPNFVPGVNSAPPAGCTTDLQCCEEVGHAGPGHLHVTGTVCSPCECGACCDPGTETCSVVVQAPPDSAETVCLNLGGEYKGPNTNCDDHDADGIPSVRESNDCCAGALLGISDACNINTDPRDPDTDGDGSPDGAEVSNGTDPCVIDSTVPPPLAITTYPHGIAKSNYISFAPDNTAKAIQAFLVKDVSTGMQFYITSPCTAPASVVGKGVTRLSSSASPILVNWAGLSAIHVTGCMIAPADGARCNEMATMNLGQPCAADAFCGGTPGSCAELRSYEVVATTNGVTFSPPLVIHTPARPSAANARFWGDLVGAFSAAGNLSTTPPTPPNSWEPPNRIVSGFDIAAALQAAASGAAAPHFTWVDVNPSPVDLVPIGTDVLRIVNAFSVGSGKEYYPHPYPQLPCGIHDPMNPPSPALCPAPPSSTTCP